MAFCTVSIAPTSALAAQTTGTYAALGDSVAAGAGLPLMDNDPDTLACARSSQAYPHAVAQASQIPLAHIACSGASISNGVLGSQTVGSLTLDNQIDQAFANGTPKVITLTIGANDIHWSSFLQKCYTSTCGSWSDSAAVGVSLGELYFNMNRVLHKISSMSDGQPPKVIVTGYFLPLSNQTPTCANTQGLTPDEINWIRREGSYLNDVLKASTYFYHFATFAAVDFGGHELCSADPWVQGLGAPAPFHPTAAGQQAIAQAVLQKM